MQALFRASCNARCVMVVEIDRDYLGTASATHVARGDITTAAKRALGPPYVPHRSPTLPTLTDSATGAHGKRSVYATTLNFTIDQAADHVGLLPTRLADQAAIAPFCRRRSCGRLAAVCRPSHRPRSECTGAPSRHTALVNGRESSAAKTPLVQMTSDHVTTTANQRAPPIPRSAPTTPEAVPQWNATTTAQATPTNPTSSQ